MQAHEVPTHVQAEDRVLLWLTFPQIVALTAVCALAYGCYHFAPFGPAEIRIALAALFALAGVAAVAGRIGGRRLPLVAADLLRYALGARRFAGAPAELARSEPPAPVQPDEANAAPLRLLARRPRGRRQEGERRNGRIPLRRRFGRRPQPAPEEALDERRATSREDRERRLGSKHRRRRDFWKHFLVAAAIALVLLTALPLSSALAQEPGEEGWSSEEIEFQPPPVVPGRRLFVESLTVTDGRARVALRAATDLDLRVRARGGPAGRSLRSYASASLKEGERASYDLPLDGPSPSLVFSWEDELGQAGALSLDGERLPHPLPRAAGDLCSLRVVSLGWSPGAVEGAVASSCVRTIGEAVSLQTVAGHADVTTTTLLAAEVTAVTGTITVSSGAREAGVAGVAGGETRFRLAVAAGEGVHALAIKTEVQAALRIPLPPLVQLSHRPERSERLTETAVVTIPAFGDTVTETVAIPNEDGTVTEHAVSASCSVPASTVRQDVVFTVVHPERVEADVVARAPLARSRGETLALASSLWGDEPYRALTVPKPEPARPTPAQTPARGDDLSEWFKRLGWEWIW
ncbi:MAG: hypothetical protein OXG38_09775 [Chloroflexi bacterium]|nr:hypothetical protein [Chloroflexota bacterium]